MSDTVIRLDPSDVETLAETFRDAASEAQWLRVLIQDGGVKVAWGNGSWSLPFGKDITPRQDDCPWYGDDKRTAADIVAEYLAGEF